LKFEESDEPEVKEDEENEEDNRFIARSGL